MRLLIFGSRIWSNYDLIFDRISVYAKMAAYCGDVLTVVHGACYPRPDPYGNRPLVSADWLAELVCQRLGIPTEPHPAKWYVNGCFDRAAGPKRNLEMAKLGADLAIGFRCAGKSNGTDGMARICDRLGIPVERHGEGW